MILVSERKDAKRYSEYDSYEVAAEIEEKLGCEVVCDEICTDGVSWDWIIYIPYQDKFVG